MGKSKAPPAPDYAAAANQTAQGNLEMAKYATKANRINQNTPYGSLAYEYKPEFDDQGKETGGGWTQTETLAPQAQAALDQELALNQKYGDVANIGFDKTRDIFENPELNTSGLPEISGINTGLLGGVRDLNANGLNSIRGIDQSVLPRAPINPGTTAQQAIMSRLNPQLSQQEEALRTRLANQGITLGSEAYKREVDLQGQRANDLQLQAAAQGISLDQAARQQAFGEQQALQSSDMATRGQLFGERQAISSFDSQRRAQQLGEQSAQSSNSADMRARALQEQAMLQDRPLNLINALRTGNQVNAPQFQQFAQQATTQGADVLGATQAQYNAAVSANNAKNAGKSQLVGGLLGAGAAMAGLPVASGGSLFGNYLAR